MKICTQMVFSFVFKRSLHVSSSMGPKNENKVDDGENSGSRIDCVCDAIWYRRVAWVNMNNDFFGLALCIHSHNSVQSSYDTQYKRIICVYVRSQKEIIT